MRGSNSGDKKRAVIGIEYAGKTTRLKFPPSVPLSHCEPDAVYERDQPRLSQWVKKSWAATLIGVLFRARKKYR